MIVAGVSSLSYNPLCNTTSLDPDIPRCSPVSVSGGDTASRSLILLNFMPIMKSADTVQSSETTCLITQVPGSGLKTEAHRCYLIIPDGIAPGRDPQVSLTVKP